MWPGVNRSLVTILAAILLGFSLKAAVEFSFLFWLCMLSAACAYSTLKNGSLVVDHFGKIAPIVGIVVAFIFAAVAVKWMLRYLQKHGLAVFSAYRIFAGLVVLDLVLLKKI